jgi:hypothetical protein
MSEEKDTRDIRHLVSNALFTQNASNLSGVAHSFSRDIARLRVLLKEEFGEANFSTTMLNRHPICVLYSSTIASLTGSEIGLRYSRAYTWCQDVHNNPLGTDKLPELPIDAN